MLKLVIAIFVNGQFSEGMLTRIATKMIAQIPVQVLQFTRIALTGLNRSLRQMCCRAAYGD